jgi:hypothetical protein
VTWRKVKIRGATRKKDKETNTRREKKEVSEWSEKVRDEKEEHTIVYHWYI